MSFGGTLSLFFSRLQDNWVWLMGIILMIEPLLDYLWGGYRVWADQYLSRRVRTRASWAIVILSTYVACFMAFKDEAEEVRKGDEALQAATHRQTQTKDRARFVRALQRFYTDGAAISRSLGRRSVTDDEIDSLCDAADKWANDVISWLNGNMTEAAASRFADNSDKMMFFVAIDGTHSQDKLALRNKAMNFLSGSLKNLNLIMGSDQWDPQ